MTRGIFDPVFEDLPKQIPVFPLSGVILLPGGHLPLNIFEPRYLAMTDAALAGDRIIGMVQPVEEDCFPPPERSPAPFAPDSRLAVPQPERQPIYFTGCAGRINAFSETDDGRYIITLTGLIRFEVVSELELDNGYRIVNADYERFRADLATDTQIIDRDTLLETVRNYFASQGIHGDWEAIGQTENEHLVTSLAMICPFAASEKQLLLEAMTLRERVEVITKIMEMAIHQPGLGRTGGSFSTH
jgi:hypothetical protein